MIDLSPELRGFIFDCDGTLADTMSLHLEAWEKAFHEQGEPYCFDFLDPLRGMTEHDIVLLYNKKYDRALDPVSLVDRKHVHFQKGLHSIKPIQPVVDVAKQYFRILPMAVVSGGRRVNVHATLDRLGIRHLFSVILSADDPLPPKPAPDLFLEAARRMNVAPRLCHVFEDGDLGLEAARLAGMSSTDVRGLL
ncbi:MAG: HAD-IA family hydrolase [Planctomycetota bacterium]